MIYGSSVDYAIAIWLFGDGKYDPKILVDEIVECSYLPVVKPKK
jgi:hypothetical protein